MAHYQISSRDKKENLPSLLLPLLKRPFFHSLFGLWWDDIQEEETSSYMEKWFA